MSGESQQHRHSQTLDITAKARHATRKTVDKNRSGEQTICEMLYRLTGLLGLQSLYSQLLNENKRLKGQLSKQEVDSSRLKDRLKIRDESSSTTADPTSSTSSSRDGEEQGGIGSSLFSPLYRSVQLKLARYEQMMTDTEGINARGLIQQNYELKESYRHQLAVTEEMERELELYRQLNQAPVDESAGCFVDRGVVKKLSDTDRLLSVERTLARELGVQLERRTEESDMLRQQLSLERYGRTQAEAQLNGLLNDFVHCCLKIPDVASNADVKQALEEFQAKSESLLGFGLEISAAVQVVSEPTGLTDFFRDDSSAQQDDAADMSLAQAREKIALLQGKEKRLRRDAKLQVIEQMRKHKQAAMKLKDVQERLRKSEADKQLVEEQLRDEVRRIRSQLDGLERTLGHRSSYAAKAAQSVRALVELIEEQKGELECERDRLRSEVTSLQLSHDELKSRSEQLVSELNRVTATALAEATAKVKGDMDDLISRCEQLQTEKTALQERFELLQGTAKRDLENYRSSSETVQKLEHQVQVHKSEVNELRAANSSLSENRQKMETRIAALEKQLQSLLTERRETMSRQQIDSSQRTSGGVRYLGRELPRPELISRSPPLSSATSQRSDVESQQHVGPATPVSGDTMTQSLPPALAVYSQSTRPGLFRANRPGEKTSGIVGSQTFSSLQGTGVVSSAGFGDVGVTQSSVSGSRRSAMYSSTAGSKSLFGPPSRDTMQCLRCGSRFAVSNLDGYEKHIRDCYSEI